MTLQQIFDTSVNHLRRQGCRSSIWIGQSWDGCKYRLPQPDGTTLMCAAGPFILDYHRDMEGESWSDVARLWPQSVVSIDVAGHRLVTRLQQIHDYDRPGDWEEAWQDVATTFALVYTPPQEPAA